jgi:hypothetical protein
VRLFLAASISRWKRRVRWCQVGTGATSEAAREGPIGADGNQVRAWGNRRLSPLISLPAKSRPRNRRESIEKKETRRDVGGKKERIQMFDVRIQGIGGKKMAGVA